MIVRLARRMALILAVALLGATGASAQEQDQRVGGFPFARFQASEAIANWMLAYDRCAWVTSDSLMASATEAERRRLGTEWFCYEEGGRWHAVYGRYDDSTDRYDEVAHYRQTEGSRFVRTREPAARAIALPFARALHAIDGRMPDEVVQTGARFNAFVRRRSDGAVEAFSIPAWQTNGWLIHGVELRFAFDSAGRVARDSTVIVTPLRGAPADTARELVLDNEERDLPTLGQVFFLLAYHRQFRQVRIVSRDFVTVLNDMNGELAWLHAARDDTTRKGKP